MKRLLALLAIQLVIINLGLAAPALVANTGGCLGSNGGSTTAVNCTGANFVAVVVPWFSGSSATVSVTDSSSNTYQTGLATYNNGTSAIRMFYAQGATVSSSFTITVSGSSSFSSALMACFSGVATSGAFQSGTDQGNTGGSSSTSLQASASASFAANSLLITGWLAGGTGTASLGISDTQSYTILSPQAAFSGGTCEGGAMAYALPVSSGTTQPNWTWNGGVATAMDVAAFSQSGGGGGGFVANNSVIVVGP